MTRKTLTVPASHDCTSRRAKCRVYRPWFTDAHPVAEAIAAEIKPLIGLRTRRLVADICEVKGVSVRTAMRAVILARIARK